MGLCIHYSGEFKQTASLSALIEEAKDIAEVYQWKYHIFNEEFDLKKLADDNHNGEIYGISFTPPECESVSFTFLSNGKMSSLLNLGAFGNSSDTKEKDYLYMVFTKTQFAGIEIHKLIIHIFKHLSKKYLNNFTLSDEGHYWETGDEKLLQETFDQYNEALETFKSSLEIYPKNSNESFEGYFDRLLGKIQKRRDKKS